ncbi:MAG: MBL fold metallo-hydrolase, partial [Solirubrobacterales bacterium]|nr:MBL fold metallo-hydrolase [Solirubrobacterales bacterium]
MTWLGHATVLFEIGDVRLLTDPLLRPRLAHLTRRAPLVRPEALRPIDAVLVSHTHRDHLDRGTLGRLDLRGPVVGPPGITRFVDGEVRELAVGERIEIDGVGVRATPADHHVVRERRKIAALGFLVDEDLYFAGDTDQFPGMAELRPLRLALLPVWGWGPNLGAGHLDPPGAAQVLSLLRPDLAVPIHWGTYYPRGLRGRTQLADPPRAFAAHAAETTPGTAVRL